MSQSYTYPPGFSSVSIPAVESNGSPIPSSSILVGAKNPSNDLTPLQVDSSGNLLVAPLTSSSVVKAQLQDNNGNPVLLGQTTMADSLPVVIASNQTAISVTGGGNFTVVQPTGTNLHTVIDSGTISLPSGASTSALQTTISGQLPATLGAHVTANSLAVNIASDQTVPVSGSLTISGPISVTQSGIWSTRTEDGSGNAITSTGDALDVNLKTSSITLPVSGSGNFTVVQPTGTNLHTVVDSGTISLPSGASTSALQTTISGQLPATLGSHITSASLAVNIASDQTVPVSGTLTVTGSGNFTVVQPTGTNLHTVVDSGTITANQGTANATPWNENIAQFGGSAVVTGTGASGSGIPRVTISNDSSLAANQSVNLNQVGGSSITLGQKVSASSTPVVIASDQSSIPVSGTLNAAKGRSSANAPVYNVYSSTNITTSAYVQLVASTNSATNYIDIFDSSGQGMILGVGGSGSEVIQGYIPPGGDQIQLAIPASSRVAYKALTGNATSGYLLMNFYT